MLDFLILQRLAFSKSILDVFNLPVEDAFVVLRFAQERRVTWVRVENARRFLQNGVVNVLHLHSGKSPFSAVKPVSIKHELKFIEQ
jgi:hypothetical protein